MSFRTAISLAAALLVAATVVSQRHPHFDDKGTLQWYVKFAQAKAAAKQQNKFVFIEFGRAG